MNIWTTMNIFDRLSKASHALALIPARLARSQAEVDAGANPSYVDRLLNIVYVQQAQIEALERAVAVLQYDTDPSARIQRVSKALCLRDPDLRSEPENYLKGEN